MSPVTVILLVVQDLRHDLILILALDINLYVVVVILFFDGDVAHDFLDGWEAVRDVGEDRGRDGVELTIHFGDGRELSLGAHVQQRIVVAKVRACHVGRKRNVKALIHLHEIFHVKNLRNIFIKHDFTMEQEMNFFCLVSLRVEVRIQLQFWNQANQKILFSVLKELDR